MISLIELKNAKLAIREASSALTNSGNNPETARIKALLSQALNATSKLYHAEDSRREALHKARQDRINRN